jgi:hypothetical protein
VVSWDRRFGTSEGLPNGRIGETPRRPRDESGRAGTSPKMKFDETRFDTEARVTRVVIDDTGARETIGLARIGMFRAIRHGTGAPPDGPRNAAPPKQRK